MQIQLSCGGLAQGLQDSYTNGGLSIVRMSLRKTLTKCIRSLNTLTFYDLAILHLEICPKEITREVHKNLCMMMLAHYYVMSEEFKDSPMGLFSKQVEAVDP